MFQHSTKNYLHVLCKFTEVREYTWLLLKDMAWTLKFLASDCGFWDLKSCVLQAFGLLSVNKLLPCFGGTWRFIAVFTETRPWNAPRASWIHCVQYFVNICLNLVPHHRLFVPLVSQTYVGQCARRYVQFGIAVSSSQARLILSLSVTKRTVCSLLIDNCSRDK